MSPEAADERTARESSIDERNARADYLHARDLLIKCRELPGGRRLAMALYSAISDGDPSGYPTLLSLIPSAEAFVAEVEAMMFEDE